MLVQLLNDAVEVFVLPPAGPLFLGLIGIVLAATGRRKPGRIGLALMAISIASLYLLSTPLVVDAMLGTVDRHPALTGNGDNVLPPADAIVILGAGDRGGSKEYGGLSVSDMALERLRYGALLQRETRLPVLVTGFTGEIMGQTLSDSFGVDTAWQENESRDTWQNATYSAAVLHPKGVRRVLLVTHSWHMPRAVWAFEAAGFEVVPAPMGFVALHGERRFLDRLRPRAGQLALANAVSHEWIGLAWYWLRHGSE